MAHSLRLATWLLISALPACGGRFDGADPSGGGEQAGSAGRGGSVGSAGAATAGSGQGGVGHAGSGQGGANHAGGDQGGASTAGSGQGGVGGDRCGGYDDDGASLILVQLINKTSQTLYVGDEMPGCASSPLFTVAYDNGLALSSAPFCRQSCAQVVAQGPGGCLAICPINSVIRLEPGAIYDTTFDGLDYVQVELPIECVSSAEGYAQCVRAERIQPGSFTFSAHAGSDLDCRDGGVSSCGCMPDATGTCIAPGGVSAGGMHTATTRVLLDANYGLYPTSAPAPLPLPGPGSSPGSDARALAAVQIVFEK